MSIETALTALNSDIVNARNKIVDMGGTATLNGGTSQLADDIATIPAGAGGALINGRKFECGTFTFPSDVTVPYEIQHTLGVTPSAVFLWVVDPDYSVRGIIGKYRSDSTSASASIGINAANGDISAGYGSSRASNRTIWDDEKIVFNADSTYPLLSSVEYQWIAIA